MDKQHGSIGLGSPKEQRSGKIGLESPSEATKLGEKSALDPMDKRFGSPEKQLSVGSWREIGLECPFIDLPRDKRLESPEKQRPEKQRSVEALREIDDDLSMDKRLGSREKQPSVEAWREIDLGCRSEEIIDLALLGSPSGSIFVQKQQSVEARKKIGIISRKRARAEDWDEEEEEEEDEDEQEDEDEEEDEFKLYVVDVDLGKTEGLPGCKSCKMCCKGGNGGFSCSVKIDRVRKHTNLDPLIQFRLPRRPSLPGLCVLKNTVYVFEGCGYFRYKSEYKLDPELHPKLELDAKSIYKYDFTDDLTEEISGKRKRKRSINVEKAGSMKNPKHLPRAFPCSDGRRILVFPSFVLPGEVGGFELYDTVDKTCEMLPPIPLRPHYNPSRVECEFRHCSFISETRFFLVVPNYGRFILDIEKSKWVCLGCPCIPWDWNWYSHDKSFVGIEGGYVMNFESVHYRPLLFLKDDEWERMEDPERLKPTFASSYGSRCRWERSRDIKVINYEDQVCHAAALRVYKKRLLIDLHRILLPTLDTTLVQSQLLKIKGIGDKGIDFSLCCL